MANHSDLLWLYLLIVQLAEVQEQAHRHFIGPTVLIVLRESFLRFFVMRAQLAEVKEQADRRIAKLNGALQAAESRCHQLAAEAAVAAQSAPAPPPPQVRVHAGCTLCMTFQPTSLASTAILTGQPLQSKCHHVIFKSNAIVAASAQEGLQQSAN